MEFTPAVADVVAERNRQIEVEGWTPEHDDEQIHGEIADAAGCYALWGNDPRFANEPPFNWPWDREWWKPKDKRSNLVRAAALLQAEIERLDRRAAHARRSAVL